MERAQKARRNTERMGSAPIFPLLLSMAIPGLLGTLTTYLYKTADQIFVGNFVGRNALGGISVLSPFNNVVIALTLFLTVGGASMLSLAMGRQDYEKANKLFTNIIIQAVLMATVVCLFFTVFSRSFVGLCGAKKGSEVFGYAVIYLRITALGQIFNMLNVGLAAIIRSEGNTRYSMVANMIGAVLNIFLNTILIVVCGFGIYGAAIATVGSQFVGAVFSAAYFISGKSNLKWAGFKVVDIGQMITVAKMGIAPSIFQMLSFITNIMINKTWLERLGLEKPTTLEEFEKVLTAFKEQDANGNGDPNDEIPMSFKFLGSQRDIGGFFGAFGYADTLAAGNTHIVVGDDGQLVFVPATEGYKEGCKYLYEHFFAKGLIDQEGFTMDKKTYNSQNQGEVANIGVFMCWNSFDLGTVHEDEYEPLSPLLGPDGTTSWGTSPDSTMAATGFSITNVCKDPALLLRWVDTFYDPIWSMQCDMGPIGINIKDNGDEA